MLTVQKFLSCLMRPNHADYLFVGIDTEGDKQLYILGNGGMGNINCAPIESLPEEIQIQVLEMITQGELYLKKMKSPFELDMVKVLLVTP